MYIKRIAVLLTVALAMALVLAAPMATAKKHHGHKHHPKGPIVGSPTTGGTIQCPNQSNGSDCIGSAGTDTFLDRSSAFDQILGLEGNDTYNTTGGDDLLIDSSATSNDTYNVKTKTPSTSGFVLTIEDDGGTADVLDLSGFFKSTDFKVEKLSNNTTLYLFFKTGSDSSSDLSVNKFFNTNSIDSFKFSDTTLTADQIKSMAVPAASTAASAATEDAGTNGPNLGLPH